MRWNRSILPLTLWLTLMAGCSGVAVPAGAEQATFAVHCYDVGADALRDRPGVLSVDKGWQGLHEVDRVNYDPRRVSLDQLEGWLKEAGTYVNTLEKTSKSDPARR
jgi:hypothetical protein